MSPTAGAVTYDVDIDGPHLTGPWASVGSSIRRESDLIAVNALADPSSDALVYWTFADAARGEDRATLAEGSVSYDLTFMAPRLLGGHRPRTHGHIHASQSAGVGAFAEVYEVLAGTAGFLLQDLRAGPAAALALLITARPGETVVVPPDLFHATINMGPGLLVIADLVCRTAVDSYDEIVRAGGMAYGIAPDGKTSPNPRYTSQAPLQILTSAEWRASIDADIYSRLASDPRHFTWLCDPAAFDRLFPLAAR